MSCAVDAGTDRCPGAVGRRGPGTLECCAGLKVQVAHLGDSHLAEVLASEAKKFWGKGLLVIGGYPAATG